jgi:hypothetical protein
VDAATNTTTGATDITELPAQPPARAELISTEPPPTTWNTSSVPAAPYAGIRANDGTTMVGAHENKNSQADTLPGPRDASAQSPIFKEYPVYGILSHKGHVSCTSPALARPMWHHVPRHDIPVYPPVLSFPQGAAHHWPSRMYRPAIYTHGGWLPHQSQ